MSTKNYYKILGVQRHATQEEIRKAFRRIVKKYHPDVNKEPDAEERMKDFNEAYEVLGDTEKRRQYDNENAEAPRVPRKSREHHTKKRREKPPQNKQTRYQQKQYEQTHYEKQQYEQPYDYAQPQQHRQGVPNPVGILVFVLILVFLWVGLPQTMSYETRGASPADNPVVLVTPPPQPELVPVQKTFEVWKSEGDALMKQDRNGDALTAYDRALEIRPDASELWVTEGDIYTTMGNFEKAISCYDRASKTNPQDGELTRKKSWALTNINSLMEFADRLIEQENYPAAINVYDDLLSAGIQNTGFQKRVLSAKMFALMRSGRPDEVTRVSKTLESV